MTATTCERFKNNAIPVQALPKSGAVIENQVVDQALSTVKVDSCWLLLSVFNLICKFFLCG
jgi:hypothetical protein